MRACTMKNTLPLFLERTTTIVLSLFRKGVDLLRTVLGERKKSEHLLFWHTMVDSFVH